MRLATLLCIQFCIQLTSQDLRTFAREKDLRRLQPQMPAASIKILQGIQLLFLFYFLLDKVAVIISFLYCSLQ